MSLVCLGNLVSLSPRLLDQFRRIDGMSFALRIVSFSSNIEDDMNEEESFAVVTNEAFTLLLKCQVCLLFFLSYALLLPFCLHF